MDQMCAGQHCRLSEPGTVISKYKEELKYDPSRRNKRSTSVGRNPVKQGRPCVGCWLVGTQQSPDLFPSIQQNNNSIRGGDRVLNLKSRRSNKEVAVLEKRWEEIIISYLWTSNISPNFVRFDFLFIQQTKQTISQNRSDTSWKNKQCRIFASSGYYC
jgi:hypothetical protein